MRLKPQVTAAQYTRNVHMRSSAAHARLAEGPSDRKLGNSNKKGKTLK